MDKKEIRLMTFGKYKGEPILRVIAQHIGYIMWCFENLSWFKLNEDEQKFYDWQAIAIKKYGIEMIFRVELMYKHILDKEAFERLETPYVFEGMESFIPTDTELKDLLLESGVIKRQLPIGELRCNNAFFAGLRHTAAKDLDMMTDEEIEEMNYLGVGSLPMLPFLEEEINF